MLKFFKNNNGLSLPIVITLSGIAIGGLLFLGNHIQKAQEVQRSQEQILKDSAALQGVLGYAMNALENRHCWDPDSAIKKGTCSIEDPGNLERLLLLDQTVYDIGQRFASELKKPLSQLRKTEMEFVVKRGDITTVHPLAPYVTQVSGNLDAIHFFFSTKVEREHGDMVKAHIEVSLDIRKGFSVQKGFLKSYADVILYPRQINMYSLVLAQSLDFNSIAHNSVESMIFKSPVLINKDLVLAPGKKIDNWKFEDLLFTGGLLKVGSETFSPRQYGHIDHLVTSQIAEFSGIKAGHLLVDYEPALMKMFDPTASVDNGKILECIDYLQVKNTASLMSSSQLLVKRNSGTTNNQLNLGVGLTNRNEFTTEQLGESTDSAIMMLKMAFGNSANKESNCQLAPQAIYKGKKIDFKLPACAYKVKGEVASSEDVLIDDIFIDDENTHQGHANSNGKGQEESNVDVVVSVEASFGQITNDLSGAETVCHEAKSQLNLKISFDVKNAGKLENLVVPELELIPVSFSPVSSSQKIRLELSSDKKSVLLPTAVKSDSWYTLNGDGNVSAAYFSHGQVATFSSSQCSLWASTHQDNNQDFKNKECASLHNDLAINYSDQCYCKDVNLNQLDSRKNKMSINTSFVDTSYAGWNFKPLSKVAENNNIAINKNNHKDLHLYSILNECRIESTATQVLGLMVCHKLIIKPRKEKLVFVGTFIIDELVIESGSSSSQIVWMNMYHPEALGYLRNGTVLLNAADCEIDPTKPLWHPLPTDKMIYRQRRCSPFSLIEKFDPFKWTTFDPVCGFFSSTTPFTSCRPQDRSYNFYSVILEQKQVL